MRHLIYYILLSLFPIAGFSQEVTEMRYFLVDWDGKYRVPWNKSLLKTSSYYQFQTKREDFFLMFDDFNNCRELLASRDQLQEKTLTFALVELIFESDTVELLFDNGGNYNFENTWYQAHPGLYYLLFRFFSNDLIPHSTLQKMKLQMKDEMW